MRADVFRPAYLELTQRDAETFDVLWRVPAVGDARLAVAIDIVITEVALSVKVHIRLVGIGHKWAIIAGGPDSIAIVILLAGVICAGAIIGSIRDTVPVHISRFTKIVYTVFVVIAET